MGNSLCSCLDRNMIEWAPELPERAWVDLKPGCQWGALAELYLSCLWAGMWTVRLCSYPLLTCLNLNSLDLMLPLQLAVATDLGTDLPARRIKEGHTLCWQFTCGMTGHGVSGKWELDLIVPLSCAFGLRRANLDGAAVWSPLVLQCWTL